ncbi:MAG: hypothetical protein NXI13_01740 [Proteobacteria bacterium]|nr:hypothetical protein [Pseudomonadota bacterium]
MNNSATVKTDISALSADISRYLAQTRNGAMIDISALPDRVVEIHQRVQNASHNQRPELASLLTQVIGSLDELSREIQIRHDKVSRDIDSLDSV